MVILFLAYSKYIHYDPQNAGFLWILCLFKTLPSKVNFAINKFTMQSLFLPHTSVLSTPFRCQVLSLLFLESCCCLWFRETFPISFWQIIPATAWGEAASQVRQKIHVTMLQRKQTLIRLCSKRKKKKESLQMSTEHTQKWILLPKNIFIPKIGSTICLWQCKEKTKIMTKSFARLFSSSSFFLHSSPLNIALTKHKG